MLSQDFANKCVREELERSYEDKTLREFLAVFTQSSIDSDIIEDTLNDEFSDFVDSWADDNDMSRTELMDFIMKSLDHDVEYDIKIDMEYDKEPTKMGPDSKPYWDKEVRFTGRALVDDVSFDLDEWYMDFEV
jgi:AAA15 family ATPase/GTPase